MSDFQGCNTEEGMRKSLLPVLLGSFIGAGCTAPTPIASHAPRVATAPPHTSPATVLLSSDTWFDPPGNALPQETSSEALAMFEAVDSEFQLPTDATAHLGFYTAGPRYQDRL